MATISDELAASIQQAFSQYYTDLSNQDQIFFGVGEVTITKPDGTTAVVPSWSKAIGDVAQKATENTFTAAQTFSKVIHADAGVSSNLVAVTLNNQTLSLNTLTLKAGTLQQVIYNCAADGPGTGITGRPDDNKKTAFTLIVELIRHASDTDYITRQTYISGASQASWWRYCVSGKWGAWVKIPVLNQTTTWTAKQTFSSGLDCVGNISVTGEVDALKYPPDSVNNGDYLGGGPIRSLIAGRGAKNDSRGAYAQLFIREYVGAEHEAVLNLNGFDRDLNWLFKSDGSLHSDGGVWSVDSRVRTWSAVGDGYLECQVDGSAKGINFFDSDETLKEDVQDVKSGAASTVINQLRPVSYKFLDTAYSAGKRYSFGVIAQEVEKVLPELVNTLSDGHKTLDPLAVLGLLLAANKELLARVEALEERLSGS